MVGGDRLGERFQLGEAAYPFGRRVAGAVACHEVDSFGLGEGGISGVRVGATRRRGSEIRQTNMEWGIECEKYDGLSKSMMGWEVSAEGTQSRAGR